MGRRFATDVVAMPHRFGFDRAYQPQRFAQLHCSHLLLRQPLQPFPWNADYPIRKYIRVNEFPLNN
jgi:hypothetical protein